MMFQPLDFTHLSSSEQLARSREFLERMQSRRTVRDFSSAPVPFELIRNAIATAASAPSGANMQPWTFVVVSNPDLKHQIREAAEAEEKRMYKSRISEEMRDAISHLGTTWEKPHLEDAPYLIVVFAQPYSFDAEGNKVKHYYTTESVGIAVGMLLSSLHLAGLATLTHTPSPMGFLAEILERPANERAYLLIPVGYPAEDANVPVIEKKPVETVLVHQS